VDVPHQQHPSSDLHAQHGSHCCCCCCCPYVLLAGLDSVTALGLITTLKQLAAGHTAAASTLVHPVDEAEQGLPLHTTALHTASCPASLELVNSNAAAATAAAEGSAAGARRGGCTIVCTIHQPQSKIFHLFDQLLLLQAGCMAYQGPAAGALQHLAQMGFPCLGETSYLNAMFVWYRISFCAFLLQLPPAGTAHDSSIPASTAALSYFSDPALSSILQPSQTLQTTHTPTV
jgi:hypothetical protein